jgi:hypothetical protein
VRDERGQVNFRPNGPLGETCDGNGNGNGNGTNFASRVDAHQPAAEESAHAMEASMTSRNAVARPALTAIRRDKGLTTATYGHSFCGMGMPVPALPQRLQSSPAPQERTHRYPGHVRRWIARVDESYSGRHTPGRELMDSKLRDWEMRLKPNLDHRRQCSTVRTGSYPLKGPPCCGQRRGSI